MRRTRITGWCNPTNAADSHARCAGYFIREGIRTEDCVCACHQAEPTRVIANLPDADYRARPALSQSGMKTLLESPLAYRLQVNKTSSAMDKGSLLHQLALGQPVTFAPVTLDGRTKAGKEEREAIALSGKTPMSVADWADAQRMAEALADHPVASELLCDGLPEVSVFRNRDGIDIKGRFDWHRNDGPIVDLKTTSAVSERQWLSHAATYRYHLQEAVYRWLADPEDQPDFYFVTVESSQPHRVKVYRLDDDAHDAGSRLFDQAIDLYRRCAERDYWPAWPEEIDTEPRVVTGRLPAWATYQPREGIPSDFTWSLHDYS